MARRKKSELASLLEEFLLSHSNINTRNNLRSDLRRLEAYFTAWDGKEDSLAIIKFIRNQETEGLSAGTIRGRVIRIRKLYGFLCQKGYRKENPVELKAAPKAKDKRTPRCPSMDELKSLLAILKSTGAPGLRDRLIVAFMFYEAFRVQEICSLDIGNIEEVSGRFVCELKGKGGRLDRVFLFPQTEKILRQYLKTMPSDPKHPLFCSLRTEGRRIGTRAVRKRIDEYFAEAGIRKGLSCHSLRHAHASILASRGYPLTGVQKRLRHSSPLTTLRYYIHDEEAAYLSHMQRPERLIEVGE